MMIISGIIMVQGKKITGIVSGLDSNKVCINVLRLLSCHFNQLLITDLVPICTLVSADNNISSGSRDVERLARAHLQPCRPFAHLQI
jgi:hypothetical protein